MDIKRVRRFGTSFAHPLVVLYFYENDHDRNRFAVSAGKSVGNAVNRNRAKRLIRAALQKILPDIQEGYDMLLIAREPLAASNCQETKKALKSLFERADLLKKTHEHKN